MCFVDRYDREIGNLNWAAPQDWMREPWIAAKTGLSVPAHQERTVENFVELLWRGDGAQAQYLRLIDRHGCPFMPVLQGWTLADYWTCVDLYAQAVVRLADYPLVGLGSVCRRQATGVIDAIVRSLGAVLPLHGFGVKADGLARYARWLTSADSLAWSVAGRRQRGCARGHASEANCRRFALAWRERVLDAIEEGGPEQPTLFAQHGRTATAEMQGGASMTNVLPAQLDLLAVVEDAERDAPAPTLYGSSARGLAARTRRMCEK